MNESEENNDLNTKIDEQHPEEIASESLLNSVEMKSHADELDCISNLNIDETSNEQMNSAQSTQSILLIIPIYFLPPVTPLYFDIGTGLEKFHLQSLSFDDIFVFLELI